MTFNEKVKNLNTMLLTREALINNLTIEQIKKEVVMNIPYAPGGIFSIDSECDLATTEYRNIYMLIENDYAKLYICNKGESSEQCYVVQGATEKEFADITSMYDNVSALYDNIKKDVYIYKGIYTNATPKYVLQNMTEMLEMLKNIPSYFWGIMTNDLHKVMSKYKAGDEHRYSGAISDLEDSWRTVNDVVEKYPEYGKDEIGQALYMEAYNKYKKIIASEH